MMIIIPEKNKTYKGKEFSKWDAFVKQFQTDNPDKRFTPKKKKK